MPLTSLIVRTDRSTHAICFQGSNAIWYLKMLIAQMNKSSITIQGFLHTKVFFFSSRKGKWIEHKRLYHAQGQNHKDNKQKQKA